jgi:hypothetical protein
MQDADKDRDKDRRIKYLEMPHEFGHKAAEIDFQAKVSYRTIEGLSLRLAKEKPKSGPDFEKAEFLKKFLVDTAAQNENILEILKWMTEFLKEVAEDAKVLCEGAETRDRIKDQEDTIVTLMRETRDAMRIFREKEMEYRAKIEEYERDKRRQDQANP